MRIGLAACGILLLAILAAQAHGFLMFGPYAKHLLVSGGQSPVAGQTTRTQPPLFLGRGGFDNSPGIKVRIDSIRAGVPQPKENAGTPTGCAFAPFGSGFGMAGGQLGMFGGGQFGQFGNTVPAAPAAERK